MRNFVVGNVMTGAVASAVLGLTLMQAGAADLQVFTSGAPAAVQKVLAPGCTAATGHGVEITEATIDIIIERLAGDARPDVGATRPDVSTAEALRQTLLKAKSIGHPDPKGGGFAGVQIARMFETLGIADEVRPKVKLMFAFAGGVEAVAKGDIEIGLFNISEIVPIKGVALAGPLPAELQSYITFAGALHARSEAPDAGAVYLRWLMAPAAQDAWTKGGMEALGRPVTFVWQGDTPAAAAVWQSKGFAPR